MIYWDAGVSAIAFHPTLLVIWLLVLLMAVTSRFGFCNCESQQNDKLIQRTRWACHAVGSYRKKPMTAAAFSSDGSVLAVAAETVITLWDPEKNILVAVIGSAPESIVSLSFIGESNFLVSASCGLNPQLAVWSMSKLSISWSYKLQTEAVACSQKDSLLAVLAVLPESYEAQERDETTLHDANGVILLFNAGDPVPIASWFVTKAKGGGLHLFKEADL